MTTSPSRLIQPFTGTLVDLNVPEDARADVRARANRLPSIQLSERALYVTLDTVVSTPDQNARRVLEHLERQGFVR